MEVAEHLKKYHIWEKRTRNFEQPTNSQISILILLFELTEGRDSVH